MIETFKVTITPLNRQRTVRVFVPKDYHESERRYPVLYMHDGQNIFTDKEANYSASWGIGEYLDESGLDLIVVGIDCNVFGYGRYNEYSPWKSNTGAKVLFNSDKIIGGEGDAYIRYIAEELKPSIDQKYRTIADETAMAGSSMGGLISTYAACMYPQIFKKIASISSAFYFNQKEIEELIAKSDLSAIERFYMDIGTNEVSARVTPEMYVASNEAVYPLLKGKVKNCRFDIIEGAAHHEKDWRKRV
ncbi:MAG: alpha/beta hydrolase-fold protein, partial [Bacillota bacterium]|nr:alpha/beta hydrolase-fold protein [Bacillota bacterium]